MSKRAKRRGQSHTTQSGDQPAQPTLIQWQQRHWKPLLDQHAEWARRLGPDAVYVLPEQVVAALARPPKAKRRVPAIISEQDAAAEQAFAEACKAYDPATIGVWDDTPVRCPLLTGHWPSKPGPGDGRWSEEGMPAGAEPSDPAEFGAQWPDLAKVHAQQLSYAGALSFDDSYRTELAQLRATWEDLPESKRPCTPFIPRRLVVQGHTDPDVLAYYEMYDEFCRRWSLGALLTWEIPLPLGPLRSVPVAALLAQLGPDALVDYYPPYYELPAERVVRKDAQQTQAMQGMFAGDTSGAVRKAQAGQGGKPGASQTAFRMWLIELSVRRRYGSPRGLVMRLSEAFKELFEVKSERITRLRSLYRASLPT